jgi:hypothetical protein
MAGLEFDVVFGLRRSSERINILAIASIGFFLLLVGMIFAATPNLPREIYDFGRDFTPEKVYDNVSFLAPTSDHPVVYNAAFQFCLIFGVFQVAILSVRFVLRESVRRKAGTFSGLIFWFGAAAALWMLMAGSIDWFIFLGWLVVLIGIAITVRCAITFVFWEKR